MVSSGRLITCIIYILVAVSVSLSMPQDTGGACAPKRIGVIGAGGKTGRLAVEQLVERYSYARAIVRNPQKYAFGEGVDIVSGDVTQPQSLESALGGLDGVLFAASASSWSGGPQVDRDGLGHVAAICKNLKIRLVVISSMLVTKKHAWHPIRMLLNNIVSWGVMDAKAAGEELVRSIGPEYTILRPGGLGDGQRLTPARRVVVAQGDSGLVPNTERATSRADLAAIAIAAFESEAAAYVSLDFGIDKELRNVYTEDLMYAFEGLVRDATTPSE